MRRRVSTPARILIGPPTGQPSCKRRAADGVGHDARARRPRLRIRSGAAGYPVRPEDGCRVMRPERDPARRSAGAPIRACRGGESGSMTDQEPRRRDIVTIGASAGGIQPLGVLLSKLPADLPACIAVVIHRPRSYEGRLVSVLGRRTVLDVVEPADGDPVRPGRVYLAPPDLHLTFADPEHFRLSR